MANRLEGKVAVVTGGGSGIGRAGATAMAAEGARVVIAELDPERGAGVAASIADAGGEAVAEVVDVTDAAAVEALTTSTVERWGSLDVLLHCAVDVPFINNEDGPADRARRRGLAADAGPGPHRHVQLREARRPPDDRAAARARSSSLRRPTR